MTEQLKSFAQLMSEASRKKKADQLEKISKNIPRLEDFIGAVKESKIKQEQLQPVSNKKITEIVQDLEHKIEEINNKTPENKTEVTVTDLKRIRDEMKILKNYVESFRSSILGMTAGSGEVRISRMDDVLRIRPQDGDILVWSETLNKYVPTQITAQEEMNLSKRVDFVSDSLIYKGEAAVGSLETDPVWRIHKLTFSPDGDVTEIWADGTAEMTKIWSDRASYTYL